MMTKTTPLIYCAIDKPDLDAALKLCAEITPAGLGIKLGLEFFNALGIAGVQKIQKQHPDLPIFLDLKYHDIPNTVANSIRAVTKDFTPAYLNVHAAGGLEMMKAAKAASPSETKLLAVTILTSLDETAINEVGYTNTVRDQVVKMAKLTQDAGLDGVVCSSHEIKAIREACGEDFILMVPGIRPVGSDKGDQSRIMTPPQAMSEGATHLVIGRPISQAENPAQAAKDITDSIRG